MNARTATRPFAPVPFLVLAASLALAGAALAQNIDKTPPPTHETPSRPGEAPAAAAVRSGRFLLGDEAPDINLRDQDGNLFHLSTDRHLHPWLIVFARQPMDVLDVEQALPDLAALGLGTVVVAPFDHQKLRKHVSDPHARMLFDRASHTAKAFGQYDAVTTNPRPGVFLVDQDQKILLMVLGGIPGRAELVRLTREALEMAQEKGPSADSVDED